MASKPKEEFSLIDFFKPFAFGGISGCCATSVIQPLDTIKVRIQVVAEDNSNAAKTGAQKRSTSPFAVAREIMKLDGFTGFYKGLDAALLRQIMYATVRLGLFQVINDWYKNTYNQNMSLFYKSLASLFSGFVGSIVGNPADLSLVRLQVDSLAPPDQRRNYKNVFDALIRMVREEGILTLWRGSTPTVIRAMAMNLGMLASYEQIKETIGHYLGPNAESTRIISSACAGVICATLSLPPDNIKTKLQKMKKNPDGTMPYKGFNDCLIKSVQREGVLGLWIGIGTFITRVSPHAIIALLTNDYLNRNYGKSKVISK